MQDAANPFRGPLFLHQLQIVIPCVFAVIGRPAVDHNRQLGSSSQFHLPNENFPLRVAGRMVVVIIESDFSPGNNLGMSRQALHFGVRVIGSQPCLVRMNPDRRVHERILLGELNPGIKIGRAIPVADRDHRDDSSLAGTCDYLLAVGVELLAIEMCVRVNEHVFVWGPPPSAVRPSEARPWF